MEAFDQRLTTAILELEELAMRAKDEQLNPTIEEPGSFHYWQGKKDAFRTALVLLYEAVGAERRAKMVRGVRDSSEGQRSDQQAVLLAQVADAHRIFSLLEGRRVIHRRYEDGPLLSIYPEFVADMARFVKWVNRTTRKFFKES